MTQVNKIDSNVTGLRYAWEESIGVLPTTPNWIPLEPNSYTDFGGQIRTVARNPINPSRQRKKGVTTDLDAGGGFDTDLTQANLQDLLQGFLFADLRPKDEFGGGGEITNVDGTNDEYEGTDIEDDFAVGDLIFASGFTNSANNGLKIVAAVTGPNALEVTEDIVDETPGSGAKIVKVGVQGTAGDIDVDVSGSLPKLTSTTLDFTTLGLIPGEWIYIGGDTAATAFTNAVNNGFKRVRSVAANELAFDKSASAMVVEASTTETVRIFFGRVLKNESDPTLIVRRSAQLERTLGAPDDAQPAQIQAEYLEKAVPGEFTMNIPTADKITCNLVFVAGDHTTIDGPTSLKTGNRPTLVEADAFNTSSDFNRIKMAQVVAGDEAPTALFAFLTELTLSINNNVSLNKAVGILGGFDVTAGTFQVGGSVTAYFANVAAVAAVRNNADVTLDFHVVKDNAGISVDIPLIALGDGRLNVEQDQPITLPLSMDAATAAKIDTNLDHTLLLVFFDYLPDAAE
jgi:hypothetical protein